MVPVILKGKYVYDFPETGKIRRYCLEQMAALPEEYRLLVESKTYPVKFSRKLTDLRGRLFEEHRREYLV